MELLPGFDLNSSIVRSVLRGWITHGDIAAVWVTQPLALSTVSCLLEACQQANVVGLYAELHSDTARRSFVHCASKSLAFRQVPVDLCAFGFPLRKRLTLFSARRCDNFVPSAPFLGNRIKAGRDISSIELNVFDIRPLFVLVRSFHAKNSWTNKQR